MKNGRPIRNSATPKAAASQKPLSLPIDCITTRTITMTSRVNVQANLMRGFYQFPRWNANALELQGNF